MMGIEQCRVAETSDLGTNNAKTLTVTCSASSAKKGVDLATGISSLRCDRNLIAIPYSQVNIYCISKVLVAALPQL